MRVLINQVETAFDPVAGETLGQLFERLDTHLTQQNMTATVVAVDGEHLTRERQIELINRDVTTFDTISLEAIPLKHLPLHTMASFKELLLQMPPVTESIATRLQSGQVSDTYDDFNTVLKAWTALFKTLQDATSLLQFSLTDIRLDEHSLEEAVTQITSQLGDIKTAFENKDYVTVADGLEHEIGPAAQEWIGHLDRVIDHMKGIVSRDATQ